MSDSPDERAPTESAPTETGRLRPETLIAQALHFVDPATGGIVPPLQPATTCGPHRMWKQLPADARE